MLVQKNRQKNQWRPLLLVLIGAAIIAEIVILSPAPLEETKNTNSQVDPTTLIQDNEPSLIPNLPKNRVAEYGIEKFKYVSIQNGEKQWRIEADKAFLYNPERLVHSRVVKAFLYDPDGKITIVTGLEAKYYMNKKDLEMYGNVKTIFPDGFELDSEYLRYKPNERHIEIPKQYWAKGSGAEEGGQIFSFLSHGLDYKMEDAMISLTQDVTATLDRKTSPKQESETTTEGVPDRTTIKSDHCLINRKDSLAKFSMSPKRKSANARFVHITQPTLFTRSRYADLNYGNFNQVLQYLTAYEDVLIKETEGAPASRPSSTPPVSVSLVVYPKPTLTPTPLRYATSGKAVFDTHRDVIILTQFPQVYQNEDTVTGDTILLHRDTDVVEVEHSNAFTQGND